ncbi:beta-hydroxyacyl-ACP dehydratase precursor [Plasmodium gonderi]|uniref:3-hydroxyacyl-[acyl-carrier-protein] dehydratase n=1 Tax=Plasmodium gonderi TaxID=77519 RepID=A0A1Y1JPI3_PLAGO|nr:beta-hydroxyacyl-ACP dehydratase precursor [Plasmodium gonderi]GAW82333.1 beta-hydroxyacyl-ACP dehydratase precursor [Plasmodium gonderi]
MNFVYLVSLFTTVWLSTFCIHIKKNIGYYHFLVPCYNIFKKKKTNIKKYDQGINKNLNNVIHAEQINNEEIDGKSISSIMSYDGSDIIDIEKIKNILPHRYPFLLVDKVIHKQKNKKIIIGIKQVSVNENFFNGHFPEKPIMPGVLQIEALAQLGGILCLLNEEKQGENNLFLFAGVDGVRWKKPVLPGDTLVMEVEQISFKATLGVAKLRGCAYVGGDVVIKIAEMTFALAK